MDYATYFVVGLRMGMQFCLEYKFIIFLECPVKGAILAFFYFLLFFFQCI